MIPAPPSFSDLTVHLECSGVDVELLKEALRSYLDDDRNQMESADFDDPCLDHQAFAYLEVIQDFLANIS